MDRSTSKPYLHRLQGSDFLHDFPQLRQALNPNSERLGGSWTVEERGGGLQQVVGSDTSYGPLVQDRSKQTRYHRDTGWKTTEDVSEREAKEVSRIVKEVVDAALEGK